MGRLARLTSADMTADLRQDGGAKRGPDHSKRQLVELVGVIKITERSGSEAGQEECVDERADLIDAGAQRRGNNDSNELTNPRCHSRAPELEHDSRPLAGRHQQT